MGWGGSFFVLPPQGSAPWGGSKKLPPQVSGLWGGSFLQKISHQGGNFSPEGGAAERKSMDLDCYGAARRRQKNFGTFLCPYTLSPSFSSLFSLRKCHFLMENECLGDWILKIFSTSPPWWGASFLNFPPMVGGKFFQLPPQGLGLWGGNFPPRVSDYGGEVFQKILLPPHHGGEAESLK